MTIYQKFPSNKKQIVPILAPVKPTNEPIASMMEEANRRDSIILKLSKECKYQAGDLCKPADPKAIEELGDEIEVQHIVDSYAKFGRAQEWPKSDNPMIVGAFSRKTGSVFHCTTNYLIKK